MRSYERGRGAWWFDTYYEIARWRASGELGRQMAARWASHARHMCRVHMVFATIWWACSKNG